MAFDVVLVVVMAAVAGMAVREVVLFRRKLMDYSLRRLTLRISMTLMFIFLLLSVLVGVRVYHLDAPRGVIGLWMAFWGCIALLTGAILCLAIADLRLIGDETNSETNRLWRDIAETIAEHAPRHTGQEGQHADTDERTDRTNTDEGTTGDR